MVVDAVVKSAFWVVLTEAEPVTVSAAEVAEGRVARVKDTAVVGSVVAVSELDVFVRLVAAAVAVVAGIAVGVSTGALLPDAGGVVAVAVVAIDSVVVEYWTHSSDST